VRARLAAAALAVVSVAAAGCSGQAGSGTPAGAATRSARPTPHTPTATGKAYVTQVNCGDSAADAGVLQQAIDSSKLGSVIQIGGTCLLNRGITLLPNRTYTGDSRTGTVLRQNASMPYVLASAAYVDNSATTGSPLTIQQLSIACNGRGSTDGIIIMNWQADVQEVDVSSCGGAGIVDTSQTPNGATIGNTSVNSRFADNFISGSGGNGFEVIDHNNSVTDGYLLDNRIADSGGDAIMLENAAGWTISGNHLYNDKDSGIVANRLYGTDISGNYIEDFAAKQPAGLWYGISGTVQSGNGSTIYDNRVFNDLGETGLAAHVYIGITGVNSGTGYVAATGNVIRGASQRDVALSFTATLGNLIVATAGNVITDVGTAVRHSGAVHFSPGA
jgi:parallel beta-helix repeat protein